MMHMGFMSEIQKCTEDPNMPEKGKRLVLVYTILKKHFILISQANSDVLCDLP